MQVKAEGEATFSVNAERLQIQARHPGVTQANTVSVMSDGIPSNELSQISKAIYSRFDFYRSG